MRNGPRHPQVASKDELEGDVSSQMASHRFRAYYVCMGGGKGNECCTMILSAMFDDMAHTGTKFRWYCDCGTRYKIAYGMVLEFVINGQSHWTKVPVPEWNLQDANCWLQFQLTAIPLVTPMDAEAFMKPKGQDGFYFFRKTIYDEMPQFEWQSLCNIADVKA